MKIAKKIYVHYAMDINHGHKSHKKINFIDIKIPDKISLNEIKDELKQNIVLFNKNIKMIIDLLK